MKKIKYILCSVVALLSLAACETYGDYEVKYSSIFPLSGQYRIEVTEADTLVYRNYVYIANTSDESTTQCWIRIGSYNLSGANPYSINGKISCDVENLTFEGSNIENLAGNVVTSDYTFTLTGGKVTLNGAVAPSGDASQNEDLTEDVKSDAIEFTFTNSRFPGRTFKATGYRYTYWPGD
jgi:hypothetical protein